MQVQHVGGRDLKLITIQCVPVCALLPQQRLLALSGFARSDFGGRILGQCAAEC